MVDDDDAIVAVVGKDIHGGTEGKRRSKYAGKNWKFSKNKTKQTMKEKRKKNVSRKEIFGFHAGSVVFKKQILFRSRH